MEKKIPSCEKCKQPMTLKSIEHVIAPPAPTLALKTYTCEKCHPPKDK